MSQFVDECRREWKRLGVPDAIANEMAADLAADLADADAEGVPAEDVLGNGVFDPRAFAASWAGERGVIPSAPVRERLPRRSRRLSVIVALAAIVAIGAGLVVLRSADQHQSVAVVAMRAYVRAPNLTVVPGPLEVRVVRRGSHFVRVVRRGPFIVPAPYGRPFTARGSEVAPAYAVPAKLPFLPPIPDQNTSDSLRPLGWILLVVGIGGLILSVALWPRRRRADQASPSPGY